MTLGNLILCAIVCVALPAAAPVVLMVTAVIAVFAALVPEGLIEV